ncbi:MAG: hypothetical protein J6J18_05605 [Oscillospiraceae bacterium]|nr:hypothetical protein [Oscillospiraceae bacterium]
MIVKLTRAARIPHEAGEIVKVSPDFAHILFSQGAAVEMTDGEKDTATTGDTPAPKATKTKKKE